MARPSSGSSAATPARNSLIRSVSIRADYSRLRARRLIQSGILAGILPQHAVHRVAIAFAEVVEVVEQVVQVVELAPLAPARRQRPGLVVGAVERLGEAA